MFFPFHNYTIAAIAPGPQTSNFVLVAVKCVHAAGSCSPQICQHLSVPFKVNPLQSPTWRLFWEQEESVQLNWYFLFFFLFSLCCIFGSALLLCNWHCVSSGRASLESQRWGTGDMSAVGTMKLPVWFDQSVCKHPGSGWGVRMQCTAFYSLPSSSGINMLHPHQLLAFILSVFFPSFLPLCYWLEGEEQQCVQELPLFGWSFFNIFISWNGIFLFILRGRERVI